MTINEFNSCVDQYADQLYRFILKNIKDKDKARDIVQDTYEKLWLKVSDVESSNSKSYMFTTAYRTMIDSIRKDKKQADFDSVDTNVLQTNNRYSDLKEVLDEALAKLPAIQRSVILLRDYEGYNYDEIGGITGLSESQVKVYIYRARVFLKEYIGSLDNRVTGYCDTLIGCFLQYFGYSYQIWESTDDMTYPGRTPSETACFIHGYKELY